jgi:hypothetical protein
VSDPRPGLREHRRMSTIGGGAMAPRGYYSAHSVPQGSAGAFGVPVLERAVDAVVIPGSPGTPFVIADLGAAGGRNELAPLASAIGGLRERRALHGPVIVVHTDIATNDFTALFETVEHDPATYLRGPDVYAFAAGRSFYERLFPPSSVSLGWSAIAVHWLSRVPVAIPDHVYCSFATGPARDALTRQSAADWRAFLLDRSVELHGGAQLVVVGGAATDDGRSGAEGIMTALDDALRDAVRDGRLGQDEYGSMTIPTWNRTLDDFVRPFTEDAAVAETLELAEQSLHVLTDPFLAEYEQSKDAGAFSDAMTGFLRGFTEPSLFGTLDRPPDERRTIADAVYAGVHERAAQDPVAVATSWRVAVLRVARRMS